MPAYTILIMRRDSTDHRPRTLHVSAWMYWGTILLIIAAPFLGFALSAGWIAPRWLEFDMARLQQQVASANETRQNNASLTAEKEKLEEMLQHERSARAEAEARLTMAETARIEANSRLTDLEGEVVNLRKDLASYEHLLKPKLDRELIECADISARPTPDGITYAATFNKVSSQVKLPPNVIAKVSLLVGNNAVMLDQSSRERKPVTHTLNLEKSQQISGEIKAKIPADVTRVLDIKIHDATRVIGYCWKSF